jgi:predicted metal-dependent enzyme (double-stranded beta helix superfamily)
MLPFSPEILVSECREAITGADPLRGLTAAVAEQLARLPKEGSLTLGPPSALQLEVLEAQPDLTVLWLVLPAGFSFPPHDHRMASVVGVARGAEENIYYRRDGSTLVESARRRLGPGDLAPHGPEVIHAIANPLEEPLAAIHVYAGDFFHWERSEWRGQPLAEHPYDLSGIRRLAGIDDARLASQGRP